MLRLLAALAALTRLANPSDAAAQGTGSLIIGIHGHCENVTVAGKSAACAVKSGQLYMHFKNGNALFANQLADGRTLSFVGEKDAQPQLEVYHLYLSRVRVLTKGTQLVSSVAGECVAHMSRDGYLWSFTQCTATDENGATYSLLFQSDGSRVTVSK